MSFLDWVTASRDRLGEDGIRGLYRSVHELYLGGLRRVTRLRYHPEYIWDREWDLLIILDACRYDMMVEMIDEYEYLDSISPFISMASSTTGWSKANFDDQFSAQLAKTAYITGNPNPSLATLYEFPDTCSCGATVDASEGEIYGAEEYQCDVCNEVIESERAQPFGRLENVWWDHWDEDIGTIHPEPLIRRAIEVGRTEEYDRLIVHFNQPHHPFVPAPFETGNHDGNIWDQLRDGEVKEDDVWEAYRANLRYVLDRLPDLLQNVDADRAVISSDHGNALGEYGVYGHPRAITPIDVLVKVPWCPVTAADEGTIETADTTESTAAQPDGDVQQRLRDLGYKA